MQYSLHLFIIEFFFYCNNKILIIFWRFSLDFIYLAVTIDGYDREKIARLKRVESERKVVIDHPVKSELEVLNG